MKIKVYRITSLIIMIFLILSLIIESHAVLLLSGLGNITKILLASTEPGTAVAHYTMYGYVDGSNVKTLYGINYIVNNEIDNTYPNIFCVNHGKHITNDNISNQGNVYSDEIANSIFMTGKANSAFWLLDNMFISQDVDVEVQNLQKNKLKKLLKSSNTELDDNAINNLVNSVCKEFDSSTKIGNSNNPYYTSDYYLGYSINQILLWQFTNNDESEVTPDLATDSAVIKSVATGEDPHNKNYTVDIDVKNYKELYKILKTSAESNSNYVSPNKEGMEEVLKKINLSNGSVDLEKNTVTFTVTNNTGMNIDDIVLEKSYDVSVDDTTVDNTKYTVDLSNNKLTVTFKSDSGVNLEDKNINVKMNMKSISTKATYLKNETVQENPQNIISVTKEIVNVSTQASAKAIIKKGSYDVELIKVDHKGEPLTEAETLFIVNDEEKTTTDGKLTVVSGKNITSATQSDVYKIEEEQAPSGGYEKYDGKIVLTANAKELNNSYELDTSKTTLLVNNEIVNQGQTSSDGYVTWSIVNSKITIKIKNEYADLALRKFISKVDDKEITDRAPNVDVSPLVNGTDTTAIYTHPKDPVLVAQSQIVTYTLRIYNEGKMDCYASLIKDDIPEGLEFVPYTEGDGSINAIYGWKLVDENDNEVDEISKAKYIVTDYLAKDEEGKNLIKVFDSETMTNLDYRDVKVQFRVSMSNTSDKIITNYAQISEETNSKGEKVTDRDSTPNEWKNEDDEDIENIKVLYFDLALRKWVTQAILTENGETTVIETGHKAEDNPEEIVKVDLKKSKLNDVTVKFKYSIRITNEGKIAGEATEISDYIPNGLKFVQEDNPDWRAEDGKVVTNKLAGTTLEPGESAEVEILLTWVNSESNMGEMVNTAEISKDHNEFGTPDIDSTPNNKVPGEDDIDDAPVMLTVKTGSEMIGYISLIFGFVGILAIGINRIKRLVE